MGKNKDGFAALTSAADINGQAISLGWSLVSDSVTVTTPTLRLPPPTPFPRRLCLCSHHADLRGLISYLDSFALFSFHAHTHTCALTHTRTVPRPSPTYTPKPCPYGVGPLILFSIVSLFFPPSCTRTTPPLTRNSQARPPLPTHPTL